MAMLVAVSVVLVLLVHFPIFPAVPFLEYDPADIPILIGTLAYGPLVGIILTVVTAFIQGFTVSAGSGIYGVIMHIVATGALTLCAGLIYFRKKTKKRAIAALGCGTASMVVVMFFANLLITPIFMLGSLSKENVQTILTLMPFILLFNLIKAVINSVVTFFLYKRISPFLHRTQD